MNEEIMCEGCQCIAGHLDDCPLAEQDTRERFEIVADVFERDTTNWPGWTYFAACKGEELGLRVGLLLGHFEFVGEIAR